MTEVLFCSEAMQKTVDEAYHDELKAVDELGIPYSVFNFDLAVDEGDYEKSIKYIEESEYNRTMIYRGWMLDIEQYAKLHTALLFKGVELINTPEEYSFCHWLPNSYKAIENRTPKTIWVSLEDFKDDGLRDILGVFGNKPIVLKDYVKSAKHFWNTACFIPDASDTDKVMDTIKEFRNVRDGVTGGFVFREYVNLEKIGVHPLSKVPISKEYRLFFLRGKVINVSPYWEEGTYDDEGPPVDEFVDIARGIPSQFFSMDIAKTINGQWIIIELGDGQVSGLPLGCNFKDFYERLCYRDDHTYGG